MLLEMTDVNNNRSTSDTQLPILDNFLSTKTKSEPNSDTLKKEETKIDSIMETVDDDLMITEVVDGMISDNPTDKIASEENFFQYFE